MVEYREFIKKNKKLPKHYGNMKSFVTVELIGYIELIVLNNYDTIKSNGMVESLLTKAYLIITRI